ncbi:MAG: MFS transporter [Candidatus Bathyarchaeota archaeon]|nr:MFS transporter [Candidatus Bathyarchaeota archaeon]
MSGTNYKKILSLGFPFEVLNKDLKLIFTSNLLGSFGDGLYAYLLPVYLTESLGANDVEVGIVYAVVSLVAALTLLVAGTLADRYDRKKIMIAGWIAWIPAPLIFSLANNWLQTLPGIILLGVWLGGPTSTAYIVTTADKTKLTLTFTVISSAWSFGYIFSPAVGGYLAGTVGMHIVFYLAFVFYTLAALVLTFISSQHAIHLAHKSSNKDYSFFKLLKTKRLLKLSILFASLIFVTLMFRPFIPKFLADIYHYGKFEIGILGSISFFSSAVLGILLGKLGDKWKKSVALAVAMLLSSFSLILLLTFSEFYILIIAFFLIGGSYILWSLMSAIIGPLAPEHMRARWISIPQTVSIFTSFVAPYVGGILYSFSQSYLFIIAVVATLFLSALIFSKVFET